MSRRRKQMQVFIPMAILFLWTAPPPVVAAGVPGQGATQAAAQTPPPASSPQPSAEDHLKLCREAVDKGDAEEAVSQAKKATILAPQSAEAFFWLARSHELEMQKASGFAQLAPAKSFRSALEKTIELDPAHLTAHEYLFQFYLQAPPIAGGGVEKAGRQAAEIARLDPKRGRRAAALVFQKEKQWDKAEAEWIALLGLDPKDLGAASGLAGLYAAWGKQDKAVETWASFLALDPQNIQARLALGQLYAQMNKFDEAREIFLAGLPFAGGDRSLHYQLGRLSAVSGTELETGVKYLKAYLEAVPSRGMPTWADAYWRMGNIQEKMNEKANAIASYEKALELNPEHKGARDALAKLK